METEKTRSCLKAGLSETRSSHKSQGLIYGLSELTFQSQEASVSILVV